MPRTASLWRQLRRLPPLARDGAASLLVLGVCAAGATLPAIAVPGPWLLLLPGLLLTALAFGRNSAVLATLLAALAIRQQWFGTTAGEAGSGAGLLLTAILLAVPLAIAGLVEAWRRRRAEARAAHGLRDATARRATERLAEARRDLQRAEARFRQVELAVRDAAAQRQGEPRRSQDAELDSALRNEGGV